MQKTRRPPDRQIRRLFPRIANIENQPKIKISIYTPPKFIIELQILNKGGVGLAHSAEIMGPKHPAARLRHFSQSSKTPRKNPSGGTPRNTPRRAVFSKSQSESRKRRTRGNVISLAPKKLIYGTFLDRESPQIT
jgi:hypothetical protein